MVTNQIGKITEFSATGTNWYFEFFEEVSLELIEEAKSIVAEFEAKYSRFREDSEVSILNKKKVLSNPSKYLLDMIKLGDRAKEITQGVFDITIGGILEESGYDAHRTFIPAQKKIHSTGNINITPNSITIGENVKIDLGGIGKGFLVDRVKEFLISRDVKYFLINAGGDIYAASNHGRNIEFELENPFNTAESIGSILIKDKALASSSNSRRRWTHNGIEYNHLVKLSKDIENKPVKAVYTLADTCTNADIASTLFFLSSPKLYSEIHHNYSAEYLIIYEDQTYFSSENYPAKVFK